MTTKNKKIKQNISTLYGPDSELIKTCENYCLSRRNIHGFNEYLVHKIIRNEESVVLDQMECLTDSTKAEKVFEELCEIEVLEIRFLRQGFIKAPKPSGFDAMNDEEQEEWADSVLESKSDLEILDAMADFPNASRTGEYFDEAPRVAAIETPYGEELLYTTKEWNAFAYPDNQEPVKEPKLFLAEEADIWFSKDSRMPYGVFESAERALSTFKEKYPEGEFYANGTNQWKNNDEEVGLMIQEITVNAEM